MPLIHDQQCKSCICTKHYKWWLGYKNIHMSYFNKIKNECNRKSRQLEFNVTIEYLWDLFLRQDGYCAITGYPLQWGKHNTIKNKATGRTASLDRIDSSQGYTENNIQWVHKDVNLIKYILSQDEFIHWCKLVANHTSTPEWQEKYGYLLKDECPT
jgi:hypothetical protein